jgi:ergothioneine biosynthesis protein EgtB
LRADGEPLGAAPDLLSAYRRVRGRSLALAAPLSPEDQSAQSMPDASPAKWHLAHTTWFFETFILAQHPDYAAFDPRFSYLFNSYYEALGPRQPRPSRGLLTRPSTETVIAYRRHVDRAMEEVLASTILTEDQRALVVLGFAHEEQHQELLLTDILHLFAQNPLRPAYDKALSLAEANAEPGPLTFTAFEGGIVEIGRAAEAEGFAFDNEGPRHQVLLRPYRLADRLITNGEWLAFMADGGYARADLWLSDGWAVARAEDWRAPLYWEETEEGWAGMTLAGLRPIDLNAPVTHVSFYEADAYARWRGMRLPSEAEWENAASPGGGRRGAAPDVRGLLGMDRQSLFALSRFRPRRRRGGRIQRQVHDQPDGAARRVLRHAGAPCARDLSQFLPSAPALAVLRRAPRRRWRRGQVRDGQFPRRRAARPGANPEVATQQILLRQARLGPVRGDLCA